MEKTGRVPREIGKQILSSECHLPRLFQYDFYQVAGALKLIEDAKAFRDRKLAQAAATAGGKASGKAGGGTSAAAGGGRGDAPTSSPRSAAAAAKAEASAAAGAAPTTAGGGIPSGGRPNEGGPSSAAAPPSDSLVKKVGEGVLSSHLDLDRVCWILVLPVRRFLLRLPCFLQGKKEWIQQSCPERSLAPDVVCPCWFSC